MRWSWWVAMVLVGCGAGSNGAGSSGTVVGSRLAIPAMRFVQDGTPFGTLHSDGRVSLSGGEHVATVYGNGQVVDHTGAALFAVTSGGNVVFNDGRESMRLLDGQLAYGPDEVLTVDPSGNFQQGERLVGVFVEGYQPEFVESAFLGWLALQLAPIPRRRALAGEAEQMLQTLYDRLETFAAEHGGALPPSSGRLPAAVGCEPSTALSQSEHALFSMNSEWGPLVFAYTFEVDGEAFVLRAEADLDCDGQTSRYELHGRIEGGSLQREPLLRIQDALE